MPSSVEQSAGYTYMSSVVYSLCTLIIIFSLITHIHTTFFHHPHDPSKHSKPPTSDKIPVIATTLSLSFYCLQGIISCLSRYEGFDDTRYVPCDFIAISANECLILAKACIYFVLAYRLKIIFDGSTLAYNQNVIKAVLFAIALQCLIMVVLAAAFVEYDFFCPCFLLAQRVFAFADRTHAYIYSGMFVCQKGKGLYPPSLPHAFS